jgi:hypothetical protein
VRLHLLPAILTGAAVLAVTALVGPAASASPAPQHADSTQQTSDYNGPFVGYTATPGAPITSISVTWYQPDERICGGQYGDLFVEFGVAAPNGLTDKQVAAAEDCSGWPYENLGQNAPACSAGCYFGDAWGLGDEMSGSLTVSGSQWIYSIQDLTQGWTEQRAIPNKGVPYPHAYIGVADQDGVGYGSVTFVSATINGQSLASVNHTARNMTEDNGWTDVAGPLAGSGFTVTQLSS